MDTTRSGNGRSQRHGGQCPRGGFGGPSRCGNHDVRHAGFRRGWGTPFRNDTPFGNRGRERTGEANGSSGSCCVGKGFHRRNGAASADRADSGTGGRWRTDALRDHAIWAGWVGERGGSSEAEDRSRDSARPHLRGRQVSNLDATVGAWARSFHGVSRFGAIGTFVHNAGSDGWDGGREP